MTPLKSFSNIEIAEFYDVSEDDLSNPSIIHLTNSIKPWNNLDAINSDLFFSYLTHSDIFPCLKKYIENTYNINEYDIVKTKYNGQVPGKYTYMVKINGQEVKLTGNKYTLNL